MVRRAYWGIAVALLAAAGMAGAAEAPPAPLPSWCAPVNPAALPDAFHALDVQDVTLTLRMGADRPEDAARIATLIGEHMRGRPFYVSDDESQRPVIVTAVVRVRVETP